MLVKPISRAIAHLPHVFHRLHTVLNQSSVVRIRLKLHRSGELVVRGGDMIEQGMIDCQREMKCSPLLFRGIDVHCIANGLMICDVQREVGFGPLAAKKTVIVFDRPVNVVRGPLVLLQCRSKMPQYQSVSRD